MKKKINIFGFTVSLDKLLATILLSVLGFLIVFVVDALWYPISWYGLFIGIGFVIAVVIASALAKERGIYKDFSYDLVWLVFPFAILGARAFYVLTSPGEFSNFLDVLKVWEGGLSIYGGIIGGVIAVLLFAKIKKINAIKIMDVTAPVLALAQSIGRWGNFVNQEVYGFEVKNKAFQWFPFAVKITNNGAESWHLATFFYESVLNLTAFFVMTIILRKSKKTGIVLFSYTLWYGIVRMILESLRMQEFILYIPGTSIRFSFMISVIFAIFGLSGLLYLKIKEKRMSSGV